MSEYTPTDGEVELAYAERAQRVSGIDHFVAAKEFGLWLNQVKADAWDEGHRTPWQREDDDCQCSAWTSSECACGLYGTGRLITPNPYREADHEDH